MVCNQHYCTNSDVDYAYKGKIQKKSNSQTEEIRSVYEEKLKTLADSKEQLLEEISNLKQQKTRVECTVHFKEEIGDCEERLRNISSEEKDTAVKEIGRAHV